MYLFIYLNVVKRDFLGCKIAVFPSCSNGFPVKHDQKNWGENMLISLL